MADELSAPLVRRADRATEKRKARNAALPASRRELPIARLAIAAVVLIAGGLAVRVMLVDDPNGGRPSTEVPITSTHNGNSVAGEVATAALGAAPAAAPVSGPTTSQPVANGPSFMTLGDDVPAADPADPRGATGLADASGVIPDLAEKTNNGPVPRIGPDGTTPFQAYARSVPPADGKPMIAVVMTGLGLNEAGTLDAVAALPPEISLAFAPYGKTLPQTVGAARAEGHELLLEIPLEPFDYPDNDPGPDTLLTGQPPRANLDKLFWLMARFGGYVGVMNHMGARFTASGADFGPVMEELGSRGLGYLDDGSSNRSIAPQLASTNKVPYGRADLLLDETPAPEPIAAQLAALEAEATAKGSAIGIVSALPVSIDAVTTWAKGLEDRGFALVPVSALMKASS